MTRSNPNPMLGGVTLAGHRYRVIVSTDIGGTDPDDSQFMVHLLVYADSFDIEGLILSSGVGPGRNQDIWDVIDCYEQDYDNLKKYSDKLSPSLCGRAKCNRGFGLDRGVCAT